MDNTTQLNFHQNHKYTYHPLESGFCKINNIIPLISYMSTKINTCIVRCSEITSAWHSGIFQEKKKEIWLSPMTKAPTPTEIFKLSVKCPGFWFHFVLHVIIALTKQQQTPLQQLGENHLKFGITLKYQTKKDKQNDCCLEVICIKFCIWNWITSSFSTDKMKKFPFAWINSL